MTLKSDKKFAGEVFLRLKKEYPRVKPALNYRSAFQLLISTILSAQCTDERVNIVTKELFKKYRRPEDFIKASNEELERDIYSTGFYRQKAKNIKRSCNTIIEKYHGKVPRTFDELIDLPGVGRKTASVVAGHAFGISSIAVDTHVKRLSNLLGLVKSNDPTKIEFRLKELLPESDWINAGHWLAAHGRKVCIARRPNCLECFLGDICPSFNTLVKKDSKKISRVIK